MSRFLNQTGLLPEAQLEQFAIGIVGTGAIGSFVAMALTKMGFKYVVTWDFDKIEEHNIANQMFPLADVGKRKAIATRDMIEKFSGEKAICLATKATGEGVLSYMDKAFNGKTPIVILAVDSLDIRKEIVEGMANLWGTSVIDARMGARTYRVLSFYSGNHEQRTQYLATLVPDGEAVQERCGQKSIIYTVLGVAAEVCNVVHHIVTRRNLDNANRNTMPEYPSPVVFDYGSGIRLQRQHVAETVVL
jgi:molybdopterin/thiamine biosynthesis adenylyltransferase